MKTKKTKIEIYAETIRLSAGEKRDLKARIVSYMDYHPMMSTMKPVQPVVASFESFVQVRLNAWFLRPIAGIVAVVLIVGLPLAAESAQPGDVLYMMKVRVNEEVQARLALSPYEKVAWDVTRVERRVAEARLLAKEGKLTTEAETQLAVTLKEHTDSAAENIALLRTTDADGAAVAQVTFESALDVQTAMLETSTSTTYATGTSIADIAAVVKVAKEDVGNAADAALADSPLSYERMNAQIESQTTRARELLTAVSEIVSTKEKGEIDRRFEDIDRAIVSARGQKDEGQESEAIDSLKKILSDIQKLVTFMTDIDVRSTVTVEALVPKKLTADERLANINQSLEALKRTHNELSQLPVQAQSAFTQKIAVGMELLPKMFATIEEQRERNNLDGAEVGIHDALALAEDIKKLSILDGEAPTTTPPVITPSTTSTTTATTSTAQ